MKNKGNRKNLIIKNSTVGLFSQVITLIFTFVTRNLFIKYIGIELLGLNSTLASVLSTLSLAELGFQSAIVYNLYQPIHDNNYEEINSIINILKIIYRGIGIFFIVAALAVTPFLKYIVKGIEVDFQIYVFFWLQAAASTCTYFLAYKRAILFADQKDYISKTIDLIFNIVFNVIICITLIVYKSYFLYLVLKIIQTYLSNIIVHFYCTINYPFLKKGKIDFTRLKMIWNNVKDIFSGRIASFVYSSTDNLVISTFVSTVSVGFLVNYTTVFNSLKTLTSSVLSPIIPILGNYLIEEEDNNSRENLFKTYTFVRYIIALVVVIPSIILINSFITMWIGGSMILEPVIIILLGCDFYIHLVHSATCDFINGAGLFKSDKYIEIIGALCNIVTSIILVQFCGIKGVLIGTIISQVILWIGRSLIVYRECLKLGGNRYVHYWIDNIIYLFIAVILVVVLNKCYMVLPIKNIILRFIVGGIICELCIGLAVLFIFRRTKELRFIIKFIKRKKV